MLFILLPLFSLIVLNLPFRAMMKKAAFWWLLVLLALQVYLAIGYVFGFFGFDLNAPIYPLSFSLNVDNFGCVALLSTAVVLGAVLLAAKYIIKEEEKLFNFISLLFIILAGSNGLALTTDIFSLYIFIEITTVASFILISFDKEKLVLEAVFKYIILSAVATVLMLLSIALFLLVSGKTDFSAIHAVLINSPHSLIVMFATGVFICALFIKGGLMPFHGWLPDVYSSAPAPVSALLAGIITKLVGIFTLMRLLVSVVNFDNPIRQVILFVGALSVVAGALAAAGQSDFKRMLAYSSISQVGYIVLGLGAGNALGIMGALFHLFNHSVFKSSLFINSAAIELQAGTRDMNKLGGLSAKMPVTSTTCLISSLSTAGMPPLAGFWSKLIIVLALWASGNYGYAALAVIAGILTLAYFISMQRRVFFGNIKEEFAGIKEPGFGLLLPACLLSAITIGLGLVFPFCLKLLKF